MALMSSLNFGKVQMEDRQRVTHMSPLSNVHRRAKNLEALIYNYSRTPPYEHSAQANTPLEWTILAGPKHFSC